MPKQKLVVYGFTLTSLIFWGLPLILFDRTIPNWGLDVVAINVLLLIPVWQGRKWAMLLAFVWCVPVVGAYLAEGNIEQKPILGVFALIGIAEAATLVSLWSGASLGQTHPERTTEPTKASKR